MSCFQRRLKCLAVLGVVVLVACPGPPSQEDAAQDAAQEVALPTDAPPTPIEDAPVEVNDATPRTADVDPIDVALEVALDTAPPNPLEKVAYCKSGYGEPEVDTKLDTPELVEASGLVASRAQPGVFWTHNDSGDGPRLYAVSVQGKLLARLDLEGIEPTDIEDIAWAQCPDGSADCLWVADIGNNNVKRDEFALYVVPEPTISGTGTPETLTTADVGILRFDYPVEIPDAEALLVSPDGSQFWVFEKTSSATARLFASSGPLSSDSVQTLTEVQTFPSPGLDVPMGRMITAADLHPSGLLVLLRTYTGVFEYTLGEGFDFQPLLAEPTVVAWGPLEEPQGESVAYDASGEGAWTLSEDPNFKGYQPLIHYPCL